MVQPFNRSISEISLFGIANPVIDEDPIQEDIDEGLYEREVRGRVPREINSVRRTIIIILVSAVIFVTVVSIYDVFRLFIDNDFARRALFDPRSHNESDVIDRALVANEGLTQASIFFMFFCLVVAVTIIPLLLWFIE